MQEEAAVGSKETEENWQKYDKGGHSGTDTGKCTADSGHVCSGGDSPYFKIPCL